MGLNARGIIGIVEVIIYVPILIVGGVLSFRHGFVRRAGWVLLVILAIVRIIGGITHVLSENNPTNETERIIYTIMEAAGLSPLLVATLGFLRTVTQYGLDRTALVTRGLRGLGIVGTVGLILAISGGTSAGNAKTQSDLDGAATQRHAGSLLLLAVYGGIVALTFYCWQNVHLILKHRRQLLRGITASLLFLCVRAIYGVLSSFAPYPVGIQDGHQVLTMPSNSGLGRFSSVSSEWGIYLVMSVLMEYASVLIYVVVGIITPLDKDSPDCGKTTLQARQESDEAHAMQSYVQPQRMRKPTYAYPSG